MTIDEAIQQARYVEDEHSDCWRNCENTEKCCKECEYEHEQIAEWLEKLKVIKEMDLSIPQHFTKEQSDWIKKYCINRNKEFYNKALDDFVKFANTMPTVETEDGTIRPMWLEEMAEQLKGKYNEQRNNNR